MSKIVDAQKQIRALKMAYAKVFSGPEGQIVLKDLERVGFLNTTSWAENPNRLIFNEGCRAMILHINTMRRVDDGKKLDAPEAIKNEPGQSESEQG